MQLGTNDASDKRGSYSHKQVTTRYAQFLRLLVNDLKVMCIVLKLPPKKDKRLNAYINTLWEHIEQKCNVELPQIALMSPIYDVDTMISADGIHYNACVLRFVEDFIREIAFPKERAQKFFQASYLAGTSNKTVSTQTEYQEKPEYIVTSSLDDVEVQGKQTKTRKYPKLPKNISGSYYGTNIFVIE